MNMFRSETRIGVCIIDMGGVCGKYDDEEESDYAEIPSSNMHLNLARPQNFGPNVHFGATPSYSGAYQNQAADTHAIIPLRGPQTGNAHPAHPRPSLGGKHDKRHPSMALGLGMALQQAGHLVGAMANVENMEAQIRKAKAEMKTITVLNGCLYIDYQYIGKIPPGMTVSV